VTAGFHRPRPWQPPACRSPLGRPPRAPIIACFVLAVCATGCVQRRVTVRSNPPGALVYIGKHEIGKTPCSVGFLWYGEREIKLVKDGFETLTVKQWIGAPWYQIPPLDFVSENVYPYKLRDERVFDYQLIPQRVTAVEQLKQRAENLRQANRLENALLAPPAQIVPPMPRGALPPPGAPGMILPSPAAPAPGMLPTGVLPPPPGYYPLPGPQPSPGPR
jgi:hypothetical protein